MGRGTFTAAMLGVRALNYVFQEDVLRVHIADSARKCSEMLHSRCDASAEPENRYWNECIVVTPQKQELDLKKVARDLIECTQSATTRTSAIGIEYTEPRCHGQL